ncbi:MAG: BamA/TamA family outer membrane protein [Candidatus Neomarinimicrobiota bacterium]
MFNKIIEKRPYIGLFLFLLISISNSYGNKAKGSLISIIEVKGNNKTLDYILEREILHPINNPLDSSLVIEDKNRLDNLGLFSESTWHVIPLENGTSKLVYFVKESINKTPPLILPTYKEDVGWSLAGLWIINNFRGKNQSLTLGGSIGGEDTYGLSFTDPWIFGDHISLSLNVGRTLYGHRFLNKQLDVNSFYVNLGKWYGNSIKTSIGIELETKFFYDDTYKDKFYYLGLIGDLRYDTRDIYWNPGRGVLFSQKIYHREGIIPDNWGIMLWNQSFSWYKQINGKVKKSVIALNASFQNKIGNKSRLWLDYFGNGTTVRGWPLPYPDLYFSKKESFRFGHESILFSAEIRQELIPKYATSYGFESGLAIVIFSDVGVISNNWVDLKNQMPMYGLGVGIRIPFPIVGVIRVDYGWGYSNQSWNSGAIHWGTGQKF